MDESGELAELERRLRENGPESLTAEELERIQDERWRQYRRNQILWHKRHGLLQPERAARECFRKERRQAVAVLARVSNLRPISDRVVRLRLVGLPQRHTTGQAAGLRGQQVRAAILITNPVMTMKTMF